MFGLLFYGCHAQAQTTDIQAIRIWHAPDKTRLVFDVSADVRYQVFSLENPSRLVVDIENGGLSADLPALAKNQRIAAMRSGQPKPNVLRVVLDLKQALTSNAFVLTPNELYGHRLVVDLLASVTSPSEIDQSKQPSRATILEQRGDKGSSDDHRNAPSLTLGKTSKLRVAIDAGHGGEDPGAIGHRGSQEKKITLSIAKKLLNVVNADAHMEAFLVRTGDYYIKLHERRQMARAKGADVFISIHADAFKHKSANGLSVFALSQRGATSAMASTLAAKENASDLIGGVSLANKDELLAKVLVDLSMTATISDSVNLGGRVLKELGSVGRLHSKRVEQAGFAVLKSPDMPSILVETGFITNPEEERRLRTSRYQTKIAQAIYRALKGFNTQTPYRNSATYARPQLSASTRVGEKKQLVKHKVKRGDSLSALAVKYNTTMASIKRQNGLKRDTLWLGETLKISAPSSSPSNADAAQSRASKPQFHLVRRGDSLSKISARYNVTIAHLKRLNGLKKSVVYPGQKLKLSGSQSSTAVAKSRVHVVRRGDTLSEIAQRYGASMQAIIKLNGLSTKTVYLGQRLKIPS